MYIITIIYICYIIFPIVINLLFRIYMLHTGSKAVTNAGLQGMLPANPPIAGNPTDVQIGMEVVRANKVTVNHELTNYSEIAAQNLSAAEMMHNRMVHVGQQVPGDIELWVCSIFTF